MMEGLLALMDTEALCLIDPKAERLPLRLPVKCNLIRMPSA
jgi:hypothetical protein